MPAETEAASRPEKPNFSAKYIITAVAPTMIEPRSKSFQFNFKIALILLKLANKPPLIIIPLSS